MEIFFEKSVTNDKIDKKKKRTLIFKILKYLCAVLIAVAVILVINTPLSTSEETSVGYKILNFVLAVLFFLSPPIIGFITFGRLINTLNVEYDYFIMGDILRVVKVVNRIKRKKFLEIKFSQIVNIGDADSESFNRYSEGGKIKPIIAYCDDNAPLLIYICYNSENGKKIVILEADEEFLSAIKKAFLSSTVFDDSLKSAFKKVKNDIS